MPIPSRSHFTAEPATKIPDAGRIFDAVIIGSPNVNAGYKLVNNPHYPEIAADFERTFRVLKSLPCDLFLGAHGDYFDMLTKRAHLRPGGPNPFVDPAGYRKYVAEKEQAFRSELAKQKPTAQSASAP